MSCHILGAGEGDTCAMMPPHHRVPSRLSSSLLPGARASLHRTGPCDFRHSIGCNIGFLVGHLCYVTWKARCNARFLVYMGYTFVILYNQNVLKNKQENSTKPISPSPLGNIQFKIRVRTHRHGVFPFGKCRSLWGRW